MASAGSRLGHRLTRPWRHCNDNWSAVWTGRFYFDAGDYVFQAGWMTACASIIDGQRVIDAWSDGFKEPANTFRGVGGGNHEITVEYYERWRHCLRPRELVSPLQRRFGRRRRWHGGGSVVE